MCYQARRSYRGSCFSRGHVSAEFRIAASLSCLLVNWEILLSRNVGIIDLHRQTLFEIQKQQRRPVCCNLISCTITILDHRIMVKMNGCITVLLASYRFQVL